MDDCKLLSQVIAAVQSVCAQRPSPTRLIDIAADTSLTDDLAFDSLAFVDLGLELELRLRNRRISVHDWVDAEVRSARSCRRRKVCTVRSLAKHVRRQGPSQ